MRNKATICNILKPPANFSRLVALNLGSSGRSKRVWSKSVGEGMGNGQWD
ncbi:MAG: hypothetical protein KME30_24595 [Iphinoe sp. HA4291-MV1]|nr:hypothetical protein [Iphinoe sp. HA4291-MV1]